MSARERLPNRRRSQSFDIEVNGRKYRCTVSCFSDGRLGEIFLSNNKAGSDSDTAAKIWRWSVPSPFNTALLSKRFAAR